MAGEPFYFRNGRYASSLLEFRIILGTMPDDEFESHVNSAKNDFAEWIEHSLLKPELASELRPITSRTKIYEMVSDEISGKKNAAWQVKGWFMGPKNEVVHEEIVKDAPIQADEAPKPGVPPSPETKKTERTLMQEEKDIEKFATREFLYGVLLGLLIGVIAMMVLVQLKWLPY